jgi:CRP-like cAMP-binding protein
MESTRVGAISFFAGLPHSELAAVADVASELDVASGKAVATEGDFGHALFVIESGTADVKSNGETLRAVGPGDVVGEVAVLHSGRRTASVVATSPLKALVLFKRDVWRLEQDAPETARRLHAVFESRDEQG